MIPIFDTDRLIKVLDEEGYSYSLTSSHISVSKIIPRLDVPQYNYYMIDNHGYVTTFDNDSGMIDSVKLIDRPVLDISFLVIRNEVYTCYLDRKGVIHLEQMVIVLSSKISKVQDGYVYISHLGMFLFCVDEHHRFCLVRVDNKESGEFYGQIEEIYLSIGNVTSFVVFKGSDSSINTVAVVDDGKTYVIKFDDSQSHMSRLKIPKMRSVWLNSSNLDDGYLFFLDYNDDVVYLQPPNTNLFNLYDRDMYPSSKSDLVIPLHSLYDRDMYPSIKSVMVNKDLIVMAGYDGSFYYIIFGQTTVRKLKFHGSKYSLYPSSRDELVVNGPSLWICYSFHGHTYHLFGELHTDGEYYGNGECTSLVYDYVHDDFETRDTNRNCIDTASFLTMLSDNAVRDGNSLDVFLELRYQIRRDEEYEEEKLARHREMILEGPESLSGNKYGLLYVESVFHDCLSFIKTGCKYSPYVRFHYTDLRESADYDFFSTMSRIITIISDIDEEKLEILIYHLETLTTAIEIMWSDDLYRLILQSKLRSNDYLRDIEILFEDKEFQHNEIINKFVFGSSRSDEYLIKHGRHVIATQLYKLSKENIMINGRNLRDIIIRFFIAKYDRLNFPYFMIKLRDAIIRVGLSKSDIDLPHSVILSKLDLLSEAFDNFPSDLEIELTLLDMDLYLLPRMFRDFGGKSTVLTMAGRKHILSIDEFFRKELLLEPLATSGDTSREKRWVTVKPSLFEEDEP